MHLVASNYHNADLFPDDDGSLSWGIFFTANKDDADWLYDSGDMTQEQAEMVVRMLLRHWPTAQDVLFAIEDGKIGIIDRVVQAVREGRTRCVGTINEGTDWGSFQAEVVDVFDGTALTAEEARETTSLDFGDEFYEAPETDDGDDDDDDEDYEDYEVEDYEVDGWVEEIAVEAGMLGGVKAYNEVRGYDVEDVEPCGHHCDLSCPRCGGE